MEKKSDKKVNYYEDVDPAKFANWTLRFGKHKGTTFQNLYDNEPEYCEWICEKFDSKEPLRRFIESH